MRKSFLILFLLVLTTLAVPPVACDTVTSPFTVTDDLGREVNIEKTPESVVSLAPSITEILFAIGLGDKIVGVTTKCDYPDGAKEKPKVGPYYSTSLESIIDKEPDIIFSDGYDPVGDKIEEVGIPLVVVQPADIAGVLKSIELVAKVMNVEKEGVELVAQLQGRIDAVTAKTSLLAQRPTVFFEIDATDQTRPWTAGPGSFADSMISQAGGQNVVTSGSEWAQISLEELLSADPDVIILNDYPVVTPEQIMSRTGVWQQLRAVKNAKVYVVDPDLISRPGPRIVDGLEEMARIMHPELFPG